MIFKILSAALVPLTLMWATPAAAVPADFKAKADALLAENFPADGPGAAVAVMEHGKIVYSTGRGLADVSTKRPITPNTVFRLGSITKQFTAAVILQLAEEGKLSLSDPLSKFLPDYPKPGGNVTVAQLLSHISGLQTYTAGLQSNKPTVPATTQDLIAEFRDKPIQSPAGTQYSYNNAGYVLLGAIIEKITKMPWYMAVEQRITKPLGLTSIKYGVLEPQVKQMAVGYARDGTKVIPAPPLHMSVPNAAGSLIGTVGDLAKWGKALHGGKVVKSEYYRQMIAKTHLASGAEIPYGFGLQNSEIRGRRAIGHNGGIFGFSTASEYIPDGDVFVAVFANSDAPQSSPDGTVTRLAALALNDPFPSFTRVNVPMAEIEPLLGVYNTGQTNISLFAQDGKLFFRPAGRPQFEVQTAGGDKLFTPGDLTWFGIARDPAGKNILTIHQNGDNKGQTAVRTGPVPAAELAATAALAKRVKDQLAAPGSEAALRRNIDELRRGQPSYDQMSPGLATVTRQQLPDLQRLITGLGELQSVMFKGVGPGGADIFEAAFAKGKTEWRIFLAADGKIESVGLRQIP